MNALLCGTISRLVILACGMWLTSDLLAQGTNCRVRYQYDNAGNRTQRDWYCWTPGGPGDPEPPAGEDGMAPPEGDERAMVMGPLGEVFLSAYPSPAQDEVFVRTTAEVSNATVEVLTPEARVVASGTLTGTQLRFDTSVLSAGTYYARLTSGNEVLFTTFTVVKP